MAPLGCGSRGRDPDQDQLLVPCLTFVVAVDAPERFRSSRAVGPHFGLTPKKYQSGETDHSGRISKIGDGSVRTALYEAANVILTRPVKVPI
ncbi:transposase [Sinorhizobium fredii]